jgi:hypothetical protein
VVLWMINNDSKHSISRAEILRGFPQSLNASLVPISFPILHLQSYYHTIIRRHMPYPIKVINYRKVTEESINL